MRYRINITQDARADIRYFRAYERRIINDGIKNFLLRDAHIETNKRKLLDPNDLSTWELRLDDYRIFYDIEESVVHIIAVGYKIHNDLYIRGKKVEI